MKPFQYTFIIGMTTFFTGCGGNNNHYSQQATSYQNPMCETDIQTLEAANKYFSLNRFETCLHKDSTHTKTKDKLKYKCDTIVDATNTSITSNGTNTSTEQKVIPSYRNCVPYKINDKKNTGAKENRFIILVQQGKPLSIMFSQFYQNKLIEKAAGMMGRSIQSQQERQAFLARSKIIYDFGNGIQTEAQQPSRKISVSGLTKQRYTNIHVLWRYQGGSEVKWPVTALLPIEIEVIRD